MEVCYLQKVLLQTNVGLTRGLIDVLRHKADLINLSYGESTATPNAGRFIELANEVPAVQCTCQPHHVSHRKALQYQPICYTVALLSNRDGVQFRRSNMVKGSHVQ